MGIMDFFRANYNYWYNRILKIIPINWAYAYMKAGVIFMVLFAVGIFFPFPNRDYYKSAIIGEVKQIERQPKNWNIKVGTNWYFVQRPGMSRLKAGHKIVKVRDSWVFTVYDSLGNMLYQDSLKTVNFNPLPKRVDK